MDTAALPTDTVQFAPGRRIGGYVVRQVESLDVINAMFYRLAHQPTGAQHIHIARADRENTFAVAFKTVPADSTGVAHILEHTVLCGSRRYPVRDPFFSMLRRSLSTFMNAFTASDWTMYPFSTQNPTDYYNLMSVYLDAAFFPKIDALSFKQEGCRLDYETDSDNRQHPRLVYKGVVYNEMKGAMSAPDQVLARSLLNALYPDTTYRFNSGGDPDVIPQLTHAQLKAFHQRHYHPSNAFFYTYGDMPLASHLDYIESHVLSAFTAIDPQTRVPSQPRWQAARDVRYRYPLDAGEDHGRKCQACLGWLLADVTNAFDVLTLTVLEQILLGNSASPLRKALIDAQIGTALSDGSGYDADNRDTLFACGLKNIAESDAAQVESIILETLAQLCKDGIERELIDAAVHQLEFHRREVSNTPYPYGLRLVLTFLAPWLHGGDPLSMLRFTDDLERLKRAIDAGDYLERAIRRWFIDNFHRVRFVLAPDSQMSDQQRNATRRKLTAIENELTAAQVEQIRHDAQSLARRQDAREDVSCLPTLSLADIPLTVVTVAPSEAYSSPAVLGYHQPTSGIFYLSSAVSIGNLPAELLGLLPFFCQSLPRMGTRDQDYTQIVRRIDRYTGGLGLSVHARTQFDTNGQCLPFVMLGGKCLSENITPMFDIFSDLSRRFDFSDKQRLKDLLLEYRAGLESAIVQNGHQLAMSLASRGFSITNYLNECWGGVHQIKTIKQLTEKLDDSRLDRIGRDLMRIARHLFVDGRMQTAIVGSQADLEMAGRLCADLGRQCRPGPMAVPHVTPAALVPREGWRTTSSVSFVAASVPTVRTSDAHAPMLAVAAKLLRAMYLHREIREKGGAYGGFALYGPENGVFALGSYRDPHIVRTMQVYEGAAQFLAAGDYSDADISEAILQVCSEIDKPHPPGPAARQAFVRRLVGLNDAARLDYKKRLLAVKRADVMGLAERFFNPGLARGVAVISGGDQLEQANSQLPDHPLALDSI